MPFRLYGSVKKKRKKIGKIIGKGLFFKRSIRNVLDML